jgi:hypothetical protein
VRWLFEGHGTASASLNGNVDTCLAIFGQWGSSDHAARFEFQSDNPTDLSKSASVGITASNSTRCPLPCLFASSSAS